MTLLIMGMHRSGTSALAGVLSKLGLDVPKPHLPDSDDNSRGFFESEAVYRVNESILHGMNSSWHDPILRDCNNQGDTFSLFGPVTNLIENDLLNGLSVLKDPRFSILMPFWRDYFHHKGIDYRCAVLVRNPEEVADSLKKRNQFSPHLSLVLWLKYMFLAERSTRTCRRAFVFYTDLLQDWERVVDRLLDDLAIGFKRDPAAIPFAEAFLSKDMRHHVQDSIHGQDEIASLCKEVWTELGALGSDPYRSSAMANLDRLFDSFTFACSFMRPFAESIILKNNTTRHLKPAENGKRLRVAGSNEVWLIFHGKAHYVASPKAYEALFKSDQDIVTVQSLSDFVIGPDLTEAACLASSDGEQAIFLLTLSESGRLIKYLISSYETFLYFGFDLDKVRKLPGAIVEELPQGRDLSVF